ncbi:MAG: Crp/Fnr family transcriptional regulator [Planctomycetia bacterium]|nr:Crp/Fnr family transcriptional regulator [Planctomycetia bacterium]
MEPNVGGILDQCRLFADIPLESFGQLVSMAQIRRFAKGRRIFREGDPCPGVFVVGSGLVRVFKTAPNGKEHILHMVGPGNTFAEVAAIGGFDCPAHAEAVAPTVCALLPTEPLQRALREDHPLCLGMMTGLTLWVRHLVGLMEDIVLRDAAGRLARYLLDAQTTPGGVVELPTLRRHLASHLNLTSETFSRTVRRLTDAGLIESADDNRLRLLDTEKLRMIAEGELPRI